MERAITSPGQKLTRNEGLFGNEAGGNGRTDGQIVDAIDLEIK